MEPEYQKVGIVGVGLIGGSLGLALKRTSPRVHIRGFGRDRTRLDLALRMGAVDDYSILSEGAYRDRDLVLLATPVEHILGTLDQLGGVLAPGTVVTDVGSTKRAICAKAWATLPEGREFIGGHPVAGREVTGVEGSRADLFVNAPYVLCIRPGSDSPSLDKMLRLVERIGARALVMTPEEHDLAIAWVSHLPQLVSTALANAVRNCEPGISGSGLRDMLRLAGSRYSVWESILETNRDMVDVALAGFIRELEAVRGRLASGSLAEEFDAAVRIYDRFQSRHGSRET
jgi:prephenate dehydrogenase